MIRVAVAQGRRLVYESANRLFGLYLCRPTAVGGPTRRATLGHARWLLSEFGTLCVAQPGRARPAPGGSLRGNLERVDVDGPEIVAAHPQLNENAWLLGSWRSRRNACARNE